jgi:hypothetical protein
MQYCEDYTIYSHTGISMKVVAEQSGKVLVNASAKGSWDNKLMPNLLASRIRLFRFASGTTLIEIPVYVCQVHALFLKYED